MRPIGSFLKIHREDLNIPTAEFDTHGELFLVMVRGENHHRAMLNILDEIFEETIGSHVARTTHLFIRMIIV